MVIGTQEKYYKGRRNGNRKSTVKAGFLLGAKRNITVKNDVIMNLEHEERVMKESIFE